MAIFLSILRGINVSGQKKVPMAELKTLFTELKLRNPTTYIQSGNVVFEATSDKGLSQKIEKKIQSHFGFEVPVIIRSLDEIKAVVKNNPFLKEKNIELDKLHVTFLDDAPGKEFLEKIKTIDHAPDRFIISGKEVYVYCPGGYGNTKIHNNFFENKLKQKATTRNWKTVNELLRIMQSYPA